ncbi:MAG: hypothetical protein ACLGIA_07795 [Actinomycetes bacterium]
MVFDAVLCRDGLEGLADGDPLGDGCTVPVGEPVGRVCEPDTDGLHVPVGSCPVGDGSAVGGWLVGFAVDDAVGAVEGGAVVGDAVGAAVGEAVGGVVVGDAVGGAAVGDTVIVGSAVTDAVGAAVKDAVGSAVDVAVGSAVRDPVGLVGAPVAVAVVGGRAVAGGDVVTGGDAVAVRDAASVGDEEVGEALDGLSLGEAGTAGGRSGAAGTEGVVDGTGEGLTSRGGGPDSVVPDA